MKSWQPSTRITLCVHLVQIALASAVLGLGLYRIFHRARLVSTRNDTWVIGVSAKSIIILVYEIVTEHVKALQRWKSLKAYMILNIVEFVFWVAAVVLTAMGLQRGCVGLGCTLSGAVIGIGCLMSILSFFMAAFSILAWRRWKLTGEDDSSNKGDAELAFAHHRFYAPPPRTRPFEDYGQETKRTRHY